MAPTVRWAQVCNAENDRLNLAPFAHAECTFMPKYRWQMTDRDVTESGNQETETMTFTVLFDEGIG